LSGGVGDGSRCAGRLAGWPVILTGWPAGGRGHPARSGTGARVYTAHRGWLGVMTGISAASTWGVLVKLKSSRMVHGVL